jgi:hypothetical protein
VGPEGKCYDLPACLVESCPLNRPKNLVTCTQFKAAVRVHYGHRCPLWTARPLQSSKKIQNSCTRQTTGERQDDYKMCHVLGEGRPLAVAVSLRDIRDNCPRATGKEKIFFSLANSAHKPLARSRLALVSREFRDFRACSRPATCFRLGSAFAPGSHQKCDGTGGNTRPMVLSGRAGSRRCRRLVYGSVRGADGPGASLLNGGRDREEQFLILNG